jgi:hypothetical protein
VVDLAGSPGSGLAAYRIVADVGMGTGGVLAGAAVGAWEPHGALLACAGLFIVLAGAALVLRETRTAVPVDRPTPVIRTARPPKECP